MKEFHKMSEAEREIMAVVWRKNRSLNSAEIQSALPDTNKWKATTVLTFLSRLSEKGLLRVEKEGKLNHYTPLISETSYRELATLNFLREHFDGSITLLLAVLREAGGLDDEELRRAHELLGSWRLDRD